MDGSRLKNLGVIFPVLSFSLSVLVLPLPRHGCMQISYNKMLLVETDRLINGTELKTPEMNPHRYGHLSFDKEGKIIQWRNRKHP